jgi:hypothetical protein
MIKHQLICGDKGKAFLALIGVHDTIENSVAVYLPTGILPAPDSDASHFREFDDGVVQPDVKTWPTNTGVWLQRTDGKGGLQYKFVALV